MENGGQVYFRKKRRRYVNITGRRGKKRMGDPRLKMAGEFGDKSEAYLAGIVKTGKGEFLLELGRLSTKLDQGLDDPKDSVAFPRSPPVDAVRTP